VHQFLAVQHNYAQTPLRQFQRHGPADNPAADDDDIVCLHANILSAMWGTGSFNRED
jgi:hypothetical protein